MRFTITGISDHNPWIEIDRPENYCGWPIYSVAFVCPYCLAQWCKITKIGKTDKDPFQIQSAACAQCPPGQEILNPIPGSILDNHVLANGPDWALLDALPKALVRREFLLHLAYAERHLNVHPTTSTNLSEAAWQHFDRVPTIPVARG